MQDTSIFQHESQLKLRFNWLFILIFNIHTQVRYVRFELKWLSTSLFYHYRSLRQVIKNLISLSMR